MAYWFCDDSVFGVGGFLCDFCVKFDDFIQKKKINLNFYTPGNTPRGRVYIKNLY